MYELLATDIPADGAALALPLWALSVSAIVFCVVLVLLVADAPPVQKAAGRRGATAPFPGEGRRAA